jgi:hypothetical protein
LKAAVQGWGRLSRLPYIVEQRAAARLLQHRQEVRTHLIILDRLRAARTSSCEKRSPSFNDTSKLLSRIVAAGYPFAKIIGKAEAGPAHIEITG